MKQNSLRGRFFNLVAEVHPGARRETRERAHALSVPFLRALAGSGSTAAVETEDSARWCVRSAWASGNSGASFVRDAEKKNSAKLPVYTAEEFEHVRVECCDSCRQCIRPVDLTRNGLADPVVDEIASIPLDLWARQHGYAKLHVNLMLL